MADAVKTIEDLLIEGRTFLPGKKFSKKANVNNAAIYKKAAKNPEKFWTGFAKELEIVGVGYRAASKGQGIEIQVGYSHPVEVLPPEGVTFEVPQPTQIVVRGVDKELVGQVAADIRKIRKPEPYKGKGIRYAGERVLRKAGKSAK